jgi:hypothetical protein
MIRGSALMFSIDNLVFLWHFFEKFLQFLECGFFYLEILHVLFLGNYYYIFVFIFLLIEMIIKVSIALSVSPSDSIKLRFISSLGNIIVLWVPFAVVQYNKYKYD